MKIIVETFPVIHCAWILFVFIRMNKNVFSQLTDPDMVLNCNKAGLHRLASSQLMQKNCKYVYL